jgi:hypothetical protein
MSAATTPAAAIRLMQWRSNDDPALSALSSQWRDTLRRMLERALGEPDGALGAVWAGLPPEAIDRVLCSPAVCEGLRTGDEAIWKPPLLAEFILACAPDETSDSWSALGDVWLSDKPPPGVHSLLPLTAGRLHGPRLACGVPIDNSLPAVLTHPSAGLQAPRLLEPTAQDDALRRLDAAVDLIAQVSPAAFDLVTTMTSNLVLRVEPLSAGTVRSASSAAALGRTVIVDPVGALPEALAEVLVHEASHTLLSAAELVEPLVPDPWIAAGVEVRSPWTGAALPLQAFLHACAVWSGLLAFWARAADEGVSVSYAHDRLLSLREGFRGLERPQTLGAVEGGLSDSTREMLGMIRREAREI